jgi:hypothetical protein
MNIGATGAREACKHAMWDAGCKLPTQVADGYARCFRGAAIGIADVEQHVLCGAHDAAARHFLIALISARRLPDELPSGHDFRAAYVPLLSGTEPSSGSVINVG